MKILVKRTSNLLTAALLAFFVLGFSSTSFGQDGSYDDDYGDDDYGDYDDSYSDDYGDGDSSSNGDDYGDYSEDDYDDYGDSDYDFGSSDKDEYTPKKIIRKPYVRFIPPYDSVRELVLYKAVVEVKDRDGYEIEIDTINFRAHQWLEEEYGKELKKVILIDDVNENAGEFEYKVKIHATFPCMIAPNEFTQVENGQVEYDLEIRVRDGRYRYTVKNLVHIAPPRPGEKDGERTYFEYLMKTEDDIREGDKILIAADKKINSMMSDLQRICQTNPVEEEDDW